MVRMWLKPVLDLVQRMCPQSLTDASKAGTDWIEDQPGLRYTRRYEVLMNRLPFAPPRGYVVRPRVRGRERGLIDGRMVDFVVSRLVCNSSSMPRGGDLSPLDTRLPVCHDQALVDPPDHEKPLNHSAFDILDADEGLEALDRKLGGYEDPSRDDIEFRTEYERLTGRKYLDISYEEETEIRTEPVVLSEAVQIKLARLRALG